MYCCWQVSMCSKVSPFWMNFRWGNSGCADVCMCVCADVWMCGCADVRMCGCELTHIHTYTHTHIHTHCMDVWMGGCVDGWMGGCVDGWMGGCTLANTPTCLAKIVRFASLERNECQNGRPNAHGPTTALPPPYHRPTTALPKLSDLLL